jgi:hypothetical protein
VSRGLKPIQLYEELLDVARRMFAEVRREEGLFQTGSCICRGKLILLINSRQSLEERNSALAREIAQMGSDRLYLKPAVRAEVERWSDQPGSAGHP